MSEFIKAEHVRRKVRTVGQWREIVKRFYSGSVGAAEFCRQEQISTSVFYKWRGKLAGEAGAASTMTGPLVDLGILPSAKMITAPKAPRDVSQRFRVHIDLGGGMQLTIERN